MTPLRLGFAGAKPGNQVDGGSLDGSWLPYPKTFKDELRRHPKKQKNQKPGLVGRCKQRASY